MAQLPILRGVHSLAKAALKALGWQWEERHRGELSVGIFRKSLRKPRKHHLPRRVVVVPGLGDTPLSWLPLISVLIPVLRKQVDELIFLDFPGFHGFLSHKRGFPSMDLLYDSVFDIFDQLQPQIILGHSLGGWLAAGYSVECGKRTRPSSANPNYVGPNRIVLICPAGVTATEEKKQQQKNLFDETKKWGFQVWRKRLFAKEPLWFKFFEPEFSRMFTKQEMLQFIDSVTEKHMLTHALEHIHCEVYLLWGEKDEVLPSDWLFDWLKGLKTKTYAVMIPDCGHSPPVEKPVQTGTLVAQMILGHRFSTHSRSITRKFWRVVHP